VNLLYSLLFNRKVVNLTPLSLLSFSSANHGNYNNFITGTFGQEAEWHLGDPMTYHYPDVLRDVLCDNDEVLRAVGSGNRIEEKMGLLANWEMEADELAEVLGIKSSEEDGGVILVGAHLSCCDVQRRVNYNSIIVQELLKHYRECECYNVKLRIILASLISHTSVFLILIIVFLNCYYTVAII